MSLHLCSCFISFFKVFNKDGVFQKSFGQHGTGNGQFNAPTGLSLDHNGHVLVSDWGNSRIQVCYHVLELFTFD